MITAASVLAAEENNPLIPHPFELVVGIFSFLVVLIVLGKILTPRIQKTLEERTEAIEGGLVRAEQAQKEAQQVLEQYKAQQKAAAVEASNERRKAEEQGAQIIAQAKEQAQVEARRIVENAKAQIEAERQQALQSLRAEIGAMSVDLAGRVVGESLEDSARQSRVVDRFLEELEERARTQEQITS
ncbi:F-type H+-transporting ATPase subunit b [Actinomadura coerulea]|uniref:ATP synthase subunit b n=1 Tax=Actinomadura coerulea TaxID=46159 RepID=A0A7X0L0D7_9ACTN|nr:F0F1 ATP synthase subunit B [Actinomadura coerulea]MBB6397365.1 F-type H+-transporting ATPase subunit b [Actinomadura coerulea]GGQ02185.1 ATP synthase subunit b [Actinomadura coerulea]